MDLACTDVIGDSLLSNSTKTFSTFVAAILNKRRLLLSRNKSVANKKELVLLMSKLTLYWRRVKTLLNLRIKFFRSFVIIIKAGLLRDWALTTKNLDN